MTINDEILILANQIANKGHKPTVALIKNKLTKKLPLPVIISTLKAWQHEPDFISLTQAQDHDSQLNQAPATHNTFEHNVQQELAKMSKEIDELKQLVQQLIDNQPQN